jgi:hypothetical protein
MSKLKIYKRTIKREFTDALPFTSQEISNIPANTRTIEPILVRITKKIPNPTCLTKANLNDNNIQFYNNYKCTTNANDYKKYLYVPPIGISSDNILKIYDIDSIDSLNLLVSNMIEEGKNIYTINRILNCWIRNNFNLINNNKFLEKIYYKLLTIELDSKIVDKIDLEKEIKKFINNWVSKKKSDDFELNLFEDLYFSLNNK